MNTKKALIALTVSLIALTAACDSGSTSMSVADVKLSRQVNESGEPVNPSTAFLSTDRTIHCVVYLTDAPQGTRVQAKWIAIRAEDRRENEEIGHSSGEVKDSNNVINLSYSLAGARLTPGAYRVAIYLNPDKQKSASPAKSVDFTIASGAPEIVRAMLVSEVDGKTPVTRLKAGVKKLICQVTLRGVTSGTSVSANWVAESVKEIEKGTLIRQTPVDLQDGQTSADLIYEDKAGMRPGIYRLDLFIGESARPARSISFTVAE